MSTSVRVIDAPPGFIGYAFTSPFLERLNRATGAPAHEEEVFLAVTPGTSIKAIQPAAARPPARTNGIAELNRGLRQDHERRLSPY